MGPISYFPASRTDHDMVTTYINKKMNKYVYGAAIFARIAGMASKKQNLKRPAALAESAQPATATRNRAPLDLEALPDATATRKAAAQAAAIAAAQAAIERGKTALNPASYAQAARIWQPAISAPSDWLPDFAETEQRR